MDILTKILGVISIILLICSIICGLWIKYNPISDLKFHFTLSLSTVLISLITIILFMFKK